MGKRLFVGNLTYGMTEEALREAFASTGGTVVDARVVRDRETGNSRGFGFVEYATEAEAEAAVTALDGQELDGRPLRVNIAQDRPSGPPRGGGRGPDGDRPPRFADGGGRPPRGAPAFSGGGDGFGGDDPAEGARPRRRERKPKGGDARPKKREGSRRLHPDTGRRHAPRYRDVDDWEEDESFY